MITLSRSLWFSVVIVFVGLEILAAEKLDRPLQAVGFWFCATGLLYGSGALVLWPRQLVVRNAGNVGTRRPRVARAFGVFGSVMAVFFEMLASAWSGHFHWPTFLLASAAGGVCPVSP